MDEINEPTRSLKETITIEDDEEEEITIQPRRNRGRRSYVNFYDGVDFGDSKADEEVEVQHKKAQGKKKKNVDGNYEDKADENDDDDMFEEGDGDEEEDEDGDGGEDEEETEEEYGEEGQRKKTRTSGGKSREKKDEDEEDYDAKLKRFKNTTEYKAMCALLDNGEDEKEDEDAPINAELFKAAAMELCIEYVQANRPKSQLAVQKLFQLPDDIRNDLKRWASARIKEMAIKEYDIVKEAKQTLPTQESKPITTDWVKRWQKDLPEDLKNHDLSYNVLEGAFWHGVSERKSSEKKAKKAKETAEKKKEKRKADAEAKKKKKQEEQQEQQQEQQQQQEQANAIESPAPAAAELSVEERLVRANAEIAELKRQMGMRGP